MAKNAGGRPPKSEGEQGTRQVRVNEDIADMVAWINRIKGGTTAKYFDPLVRSQVEADYEEIEPEVRAIQKAERAAREAEAAAKKKHGERKEGSGD